MDITPYIDDLRRELAVAAEAGGEDARALAERLIAPLESGMRLALQDALSAAADEITRDLAPGSVDVRLRGRDLGFVVTPPPAAQALDDVGDRSLETPRPAPPPPDVDEGGTARISLRVPEHLKARIEEAASTAGLSVNAWLVRAVSAALEPDDASARRSSSRFGPQAGQRYTGWVR
jgi:hypothetical protein